MINVVNADEKEEWRFVNNIKKVCVDTIWLTCHQRFGRANFTRIGGVYSSLIVQPFGFVMPSATSLIINLYYYIYNNNNSNTSNNTNTK